MSARRAQPLPRAIIAVGVVVPVLVLIAVVLTNVLGDDPPEPTGRYAAEIGTAFAEINPALLTVVDTASRWGTGDASDEELRGALDGAEALLPSVREAVASLDEPGGASPARAMYVASIDLYSVAVDAFAAALDIPADERREVELLGRRIRTIADRLYDRGRAIVEPPGGADAPGISVVRSDPVPDWEGEGLASTSDAGTDLDEQALEQSDDEAGRRRALRLLVLAEVERADELALDDIASSLDTVADDLEDEVAD